MTRLHRVFVASVGIFIGGNGLAGATDRHPAPVRVSCVPLAEGPDLRGRSVSAKDVCVGVAGEAKGVLIRASTAINPEDADVVIEIAQREQSPTDKDQIAVHVVVKAGLLTRGFEGIDNDGDWDTAGKRAGERAKRWIRDNYDQIVDACRVSIVRFDGSSVVGILRFSGPQRYEVFTEAGATMTLSTAAVKQIDYASGGPSACQCAAVSRRVP